MTSLSNKKISYIDFEFTVLSPDTVGYQEKVLAKCAVEADITEQFVLRLWIYVQSRTTL